MREDGFEFDKFLMVRDESYEPEGLDLHRHLPPV